METLIFLEIQSNPNEIIWIFMQDWIVMQDSSGLKNSSHGGNFSFLI